MFLYSSMHVGKQDPALVDIITVTQYNSIKRIEATLFYFLPRNIMILQLWRRVLPDANKEHSQPPSLVSTWLTSSDLQPNPN